MKKTSFIFSLLVAAHAPAIAKAQSFFDDLGAADLPEVDVIFKCHQDAYTMEAAAGGLAGKLAESQDRVYGALLFPHESQYAYVAAPYKVSGPAFFEQDGIKFACVTVQSVKSLSDAQVTQTPDAATPADETGTVDAPKAATPAVGTESPESDAPAEAPATTPVAPLPDFSGAHDGNVFVPTDAPTQASEPNTVAEPLEAIDANTNTAGGVPAADSSETIVGVPSVETPAEPVLAPITVDAPAESAPAAKAPAAAPEASAPVAEAPAEPVLAPIAMDPNAEPVVPAAAPEVPVPVALDPNAAPAAPAAPVEIEAPAPVASAPAAEPPAEPVLAPISMDSHADSAPAVSESPAPEASAPAAEVPSVPVALNPNAEPAAPAPSAPIVDDANTPVVIPEAPVASDAPAAAEAPAAPAPVEEAPLAPIDNTPAASEPVTVLAPSAQEPNQAPVEAAPVVDDSNSIFTDVASEAPSEPTLVAQDSNEVIFSQPLASEANTPIVVPEPEVTTQELPPIPNAPEAPFGEAPESSDNVNVDPNVAVAPVAPDANGVAVTQDAPNLDPNKVTPTAVTPVVGVITPHADVVKPQGTPANAELLDERRHAAFWANFDD